MRGWPNFSMARRYGLPPVRPGEAVRELPALPWIARAGDLPDINVWLALLHQDSSLSSRNSSLNCQPS